MKYEYKTLKFSIKTTVISAGEFESTELDQQLNSLGTEGWELVNAFDTNVGGGVSKNIVAIFKRIIPS